MKQQKEKGKFKAYAKYSSMAFQMMFIIIIGTFGGLKLDEYLALGIPIFTVSLSLISVVLAIYISVKDLLK